jgi:hypothetical protein
MTPQSDHHERNRVPAYPMIRLEYTPLTIQESVHDISR